MKFHHCWRPCENSFGHALEKQAIATPGKNPFEAVDPVHFEDTAQRMQAVPNRPQKANDSTCSFQK